jgi:hypothetical protein
MSSYPFGLSRQGRNSQSGWGFPKDKTEPPQRLVHHHCSLRGLIDPLLQAAETDVEGLNLAQYSHC